MTRLEFRSVLCALLNTKPTDLAEICPSITQDHVRRMAKDPMMFFLRADEEQADALWGLMADKTRVSLSGRADASVVYRHQEAAE